MTQSTSPTTSRTSSWLVDIKLAALSIWRVLRSGELFRKPGEFGRVWARARWMFIRYLGVNELVLPFEGLRLIVRTTDYAIGCQVFVDGHFARQEFQRAMGLLGDSKLFRGNPPVFIDIGANIGTHTLHAIATRRFSRVVSIEPESENFAQLQRNLHINHFATDDTVNAAVSSTVGHGLLALSRENYGDHRVVRSSGPSPAAATNTIELVDFATVSARLKLGAEVAMLFWIDTQGHEFEVLSGIGEERLRRSPFVIEFWPALLRANGTLDALKTLLRRLTSRIVVLQDGRELPTEAHLMELIEALLKKPMNEGAVDLICFGDLM